MGFSTSAVFLLLFTAGIATGSGLFATLRGYTDKVQEVADEQSDRMADEMHTAIAILNYSTYANKTYDFWTGQRTDKWAAEKRDELTNPPSTGPFIFDERDLSDPYNDLRDSNNVWAVRSIDTNKYGTHHFLFTISEDPDTIFNLSVLWEGYGDQTSSYLYIWNYHALSWELIGIGTSNSSDNIVSKDLTINSATIANYIDGSGYLHLVATTYEGSGRRELYTDYVRVFVEAGGLWIKNTGKTTLDPLYVLLFDNSAYIASSQYSTSMPTEYWEPKEVLVLKYNPAPGSRLFKAAAENGVTDSYYAP